MTVNEMMSVLLESAIANVTAGDMDAAQATVRMMQGLASDESDEIATELMFGCIWALAVTAATKFGPSDPSARLSAQVCVTDPDLDPEKAEAAELAAAAIAAAHRGDVEAWTQLLIATGERNEDLVSAVFLTLLLVVGGRIDVVAAGSHG